MQDTYQTENSHQTNGQKSRFRKKNEPRDFPYLPTMYNHPCTIWARSSKSNYDWLYCYALALGDEYTYRYGKVHKSVEMVLGLPDIDLPTLGLPHLHKQCLMIANESVQSKPTESSITKTKPSLQTGNTEKNHIGGTKQMQTTKIG